jgi:ribosomal 30S subunit maturation factor RimM
VTETRKEDFMPLTPGSRHGKPSGTHTPDVRSWEVRTRRDEQRLGKVDEILLDEQGVPRYLDLDLHHDRRHVLLPVGHAELNEQDKVVWVRGLARDALRDVPDYAGDPAGVDPHYESRVASAYDRGYSDENFYDAPHFVPARGGAAHVHEHDPGRSGTGGRGDAERDAIARVDTLKDIDVAKHDHDPRGWTVVDRDGEVIGRVEHLMGDTTIMKVRYLTVKVDYDVLGEDRQILVPVGHAHLEPDDRRVRIDALDRTRLKACPVWTGGPLEREHESRVAEHFAGGYEGSRRYEHPRFRAAWASGREPRV